MADEFDDSGLPPGWRSGPARISMSKFHDQVVSDYLSVVRWAQRDAPTRLVARGGTVTDSPDAQQRFNSRLHRMLKERIRDARIFEIVPDMFIRIDQEVDMYITEQLSGVKWAPSTIERTPWGVVTRPGTITEKEQRRYRRATLKYSAEIGVPNPRPFETMWLGLGSMICLGSRLGAIQDSLDENPGIRVTSAPSIVGILISDEFCVEVDRITLNYPGGSGDRDLIMLIPVWLDDMWVAPGLGHPWTLNAIVDVLNQQDTLIQEAPIIDKRKFSQRRWWQQQVKKAGIKGTVLPPMYYTVTIKAETRDDKPKLGMPGARNWSHRWDVRGHRVTKASAGPKPIHPLVKRSLLARGYTIIENPDDLTDEQAVILTRHKRSFPSNATWVAVHIGWRKSFIKGPESKPYIPASWRLKNERGRE